MDLALPRRLTGGWTLALVWLLVPLVGFAGWVTCGFPVLGAAAALEIALLATAVAVFGAGAKPARNALAVAAVCLLAMLAWAAPPFLRPAIGATHFALLGLLAGFCDPVPILVAALLLLAERVAAELPPPLAGVTGAGSGVTRTMLAALLLEAGTLMLVASFIARAARVTAVPVAVAPVARRDVAREAHNVAAAVEQLANSIEHINRQVARPAGIDRALREHIAASLDKRDAA